MTPSDSRRLPRWIAWLLTPFVAWAASFLGGWIGAAIGRGAPAAMRGVAWLAIGGFVGGAGGVALWLLLVVRRKPAADPIPRDPTDS